MDCPLAIRRVWLPSLDGFQPVKVMGMVQHQLGEKVVRLAATLEGVFAV